MICRKVIECSRKLIGKTRKMETNGNIAKKYRNSSNDCSLKFELCNELGKNSIAKLTLMRKSKI